MEPFAIPWISLGLLQHGLDVSRWILEPGDVWPLSGGDTTGNTALVRQLVLVFKRDTMFRQFIDHLVDVGDGEVEDGKGGRYVVVLRIDERSIATGSLEGEARRTLFDHQS